MPAEDAAATESDVGEFLRVFVLGIGAVLAYGVARDLVCVFVSLEYFTVAHMPPYGFEARVPIALVWGTQSTWISGIVVGVALACAARLGPWTKLTSRELAAHASTLSFIFFVGALLSGGFAYARAALSWTHVAEPWATRIPEAEHARFLFVTAVHGEDSGRSFGLSLMLVFMLVLHRAGRDRAMGVTAASLSRSGR